MLTHEDLQSAGLRATLPRVMVLEFFHQHEHTHFGAEQIYRRITEAERHMSLSTVYRVLGQLVEAGLVTSLTLGDGRVVYELNDGKRHDHIVCTACGCIEEFFDPVIETRQKSVAEGLDFVLSGRQLVLFGLCANCRENGKRVRKTVNID